MNSSLDFSSLPLRYESAPPIQKFHARDHQEISYRSYDSPKTDRVMILLHGSSAHGEYLHPLAEDLKELGQVYVPNLRGHYLSGNVRGDCSYIGQLEDEAMDPLQYPQVMQDPYSTSIQIIQGAKHLDLVQNLTASRSMIHWIKTHA